MRPGLSLPGAEEEVLSPQSLVPRLARGWEFHTNLTRAGRLERVLELRSLSVRKETKIRDLLGRNKIPEKNPPALRPFPRGYRGPRPGWRQPLAPPSPLPSRRRSTAGGRRGRGCSDTHNRGQEGRGAGCPSLHPEDAAEPRGDGAGDRTGPTLESTPSAPRCAARKARASRADLLRRKEMEGVWAEEGEVKEINKSLANIGWPSRDWGTRRGTPGGGSTGPEPTPLLGSGLFRIN